MRFLLCSLDTLVDGCQETKVVAISPGESFRMIGTVGLRISPPPFAGVRQLFVHPDCRLRGIGRALLGRGEEIATMAGCKYLQLLVAHANLEVLEFYVRFGYRITEHYPDGSLVLTKDIP